MYCIFNALHVLYHLRARTGDSCSSNSTFDDKFCEYDLTTRQRIAIFGGIVISAIVLSFLRGYLYLFVVIRASRRLHNKMFAAILQTPVHFFDTNPVGEDLVEYFIR